ncbi:MAG: hypothetical protein WC943_08830 [Elusimicrobiota bacterium]
MMRIDAAERSLDNEEFRQARARRLALEKRMNIPRDHRGLPARQPTKEELAKLRQKWPWSKDLRHEYLQTVLVYDRHVQAARDNYNQAIKSVVDAHKGWPRSGLAANQHPAYKGKYLAWPPNFTAEPLPDEIDPSEFPAQHKQLVDDYNSQVSFVDHTGLVVVRPTAFFRSVCVEEVETECWKDPLRNPDPDLLFSYLWHEARHVMELKDPKTDLRNMPYREVQHRLTVLTEPDKFQLRPKSWEEQWVNAGMQYWLHDQWKARMMLGSDPYVQREAFDIAIPEPVKKRVMEEMTHDLSLLESLNSRLAGGPGPEDLEGLRAEAASDFVKALDNDALSAVVTAWKKTRDSNARREQEDNHVFLDRLDLEARRCGFRALDERNWNPSFPGFYELRPGMSADCAEKPTCGGNEHYFYKHPRDLEQTKTILLFARVCSDRGAYGGQHSEITEVCNDGLEIIRRKWSAPGFREAIELQAGGAVGYCVSYFRDHMTAQPDISVVNEMAKQAMASYRETQRRGSTRPQGPSRGNPGDGSGRDGAGGGIEPNPTLPRNPDWDRTRPH